MENASMGRPDQRGANVKILSERDYRILAGLLGVGSRIVLCHERRPPLVLMTNDLWLHLSQDSRALSNTRAAARGRQERRRARLTGEPSHVT